MFIRLHENPTETRDAILCRISNGVLLDESRTTFALQGQYVRMLCSFCVQVYLLTLIRIKTSPEAIPWDPIRQRMFPSAFAYKDVLFTWFHLLPPHSSSDELSLGLIAYEPRIGWKMARLGNVVSKADQLSALRLAWPGVLKTPASVITDDFTANDGRKGSPMQFHILVLRHYSLTPPGFHGKWS